MSCCLTETEAIEEGDDEQFDCETCPLLLALDDLEPVNRRAWALSRNVCTRFNLDMGCAAMTVEAGIHDLEAEDRLDTLERLSIIYDAICPPAVRSEDA